jgi:hypothetical protein
LQVADSHGDRLLRDAAEPGQIPSSNGVGVDYAQHVGAQRERDLGVPLVFKGQVGESCSEQRDERALGFDWRSDIDDVAPEAVGRD